jgi:signal transduction histidine kinase
MVPAERQRMQEQGRVIDPKNLPYILVVARDAKPVHRVLARLRWILGTGTLLTLGLGFVLIDRAVRVSLQPIDRLTRQVRDRAGHQLDSALEVPGELPSELIGLAENFDSLLARVAATRRRERDFIRHAAHELRTPIAGLQATTELALSQPRDAVAYAMHLETCRKTAAELGELVRRLTQLARIGQSSLSATREAVDLGNLIEYCLQSYLPVFAARGLRVARSSAAATPHAIGDRTLARIILNNLLDNAASHATPGSEIKIRHDHSHGWVAVSVANAAEDLPEDLERLFEPLFRRESLRHDADAHLGIGLTLSLEAATAMGATLQAHKAGDGWIEFVLELPASHEGVQT